MLQMNGPKVARGLFLAGAACMSFVMIFERTRARHALAMLGVGFVVLGIIAIALGDWQGDPRVKATERARPNNRDTGK